ncbi:MAG TPA: lysophospholipid acyltransferase family protein [Flexivirga sp.]|uniref:lysophospholipid acyltransferase family protein n=1 Tax=Flexivirga sp. TaxID=1962927 RepID=UPI002BC065AD|nr:lysophospholipid acyltransferase family protein [Flexivirga sp.]HWC22362.1 lysophospholipid acyltransferase family protein [Flexivirga sp.]
MSEEQPTGTGESTGPRRTAAKSAAKSAAVKPPAKKTAAKKSPTTKAAAKKTATAPATKATAKKAAPVKKAAPSKKPAPAEQRTPAPAVGPRHTSAATGSRPSRKNIGAAARRTSAQREHAPAGSVPSLRVVPDPPEAPDFHGSSAADFAGVVNVLVEGLRRAGDLVGIEGDDLERRIAQALAFLRRRLTGDYEIDDFGFDREFTDQVWLPLLRPLYKRWFRVEVRGIENIPDEGAALVVANHSGTLPIDGLMTQVAIHDEHPKHRHVRMLGADLVFESPLIGELSRKSGTTLASNPDIERLFAAGELAAVYPEGFKGVGKPFSERYKLQRFGRGGFVSAALRAEVPIIPCAIVGAEEIFPMIGNVKGLARVLGFPYFPVTPFFPLLGLAGLIPLPSKWIIEFGAPVNTDTYGAAAADDPMLVFDLTDQVRENIQQSLYSLLLQRRSVFF